MKKYYFFLIFAILVSVLAFVVAQANIHKFWDKKLSKQLNISKKAEVLFKELIEEYNSAKIDKKSVVDLKKLEKLGKLLDFDFGEYIKHIKEPYGSYWLEPALIIAQNKTSVNIYNIPLFNSDVKSLYSLSIAILIGLILLFLLFINSQKFIPDHKKSPVFISVFYAVIGIIGSLLWIVVFLPDLINTISHPFQIQYFNKTFASPFFILFILMILEVLFVLAISVNIIKNHRRHELYSRFWLIPMLLMLISAYSIPSMFDNFQVRYTIQNNNYIKTKVGISASKIAAAIRQYVFSTNDKNLSKFSLKDFNFPTSDEYANFKYEINGPVIKITATTKKIFTNNKPYTLTVIYNAEKDSLSTKSNIPKEKDR